MKPRLCPWCRVIAFRSASSIGGPDYAHRARRAAHLIPKTPSPVRLGKAAETTWWKFIGPLVNTLVACDFFNKSVITPLGVRLAWWLAFIHIGPRKVFLNPAHESSTWTMGQATGSEHDTEARRAPASGPVPSSVRQRRHPILANTAAGFACRRDPESAIPRRISATLLSRCRLDSQHLLPRTASPNAIRCDLAARS